MVDSSDKTLTDRMKDELKELKKANRTKERDKKKRLKLHLEKVRMEDDIAGWQIITRFKQAIAEQLTGDPITKLYNIKQISSIPDFYEYQNPKNARQKTNDKTLEWVVKYLSGGGTEKLLRETAAQSRMKLWRSISWKRPRKTRTPSPDTPATDKIKLGAGGVG